MLKTHVSAGYVEVSNITLIAVHSGHVRLTLTLPGQLITSQRAEARLGGAQMVTIARFAVPFFGVQSVSEVSCAQNITSYVGRAYSSATRVAEETYLANIDRTAILPCCKYT